MEEKADIVRTIVPGERVTAVHGVTYDGRNVWAAADDRLVSLDPGTGAVQAEVGVAATAGTAYDGRHLYQLAEGRIHVIDPEAGTVVREFAAPAGGDCSGMAWSEGSLWIGRYDGRRILEVSPDDGHVIREIAVGRHVTGVTWAGDQLWHGSWDGERGTLHRLDPASGDALRSIGMPAGVPVTGVEANGSGQAFCGAGARGLIHLVQLEPTEAAQRS